MTRHSFAIVHFLVIVTALSGGIRAFAQDPFHPFRPPAVPLIACDPYFSVWSCADRLTGDTTRHWTGTKQSLTSMIRIDGKAYRLMGDEPRNVPPFPQVSLQVLPTRTIYDFENASVHVKLTFMTPSLPDDLEVLSRPLTYLTWEVRAHVPIGGQPHSASIYFSVSSEVAVNEPGQKAVWSRPQIISPVRNLLALKMGSEEQPVLQKKGDNLRIDWGYLYTAAPLKEGMTAANGSFSACSMKMENCLLMMTSVCRVRFEMICQCPHS